MTKLLAIVGCYAVGAALLLAGLLAEVVWREVTR